MAIVAFVPEQRTKATRAAGGGGRGAAPWRMLNRESFSNSATLIVRLRASPQEQGCLVAGGW